MTNQSASQISSKRLIRTEGLVVKQLGQDILDIKDTPADKIVDDQVVKIQTDNKRKIEQFELHKRSVITINFQDPSVAKGRDENLILVKRLREKSAKEFQLSELHLITGPKSPHIRSLSSHNRYSPGQKDF